MEISKNFWKHVVKTEKCWIWVGAYTRGYYGTFGVGDTTYRAHRYAYECIIGPIPKGMHLDHVCRTRQCVNPEHLEPVTIAENNRRRPQKTQCPKGHAYTEDNIYYRPSGSYLCKQCWF